MTENADRDSNRRAELLRDLKGPYLGLDVGDVRIGVAVSDPEAVIARPLDTVHRTPKKACLDRLESIVRETGAAGAVVGLPLLESGKEGEQAERTRAFMRSLARRIPNLQYTFWDERFTSRDADAFQHDRGEHRKRKRKNEGSRRDELAAAMILQEWLDERSR